MRPRPSAVQTGQTEQRFARAEFPQSQKSAWASKDAAAIAMGDCR